MFQDILKRVDAFRREAHEILSIDETAKSRVVILSYTYNNLITLNIEQNESLRDALLCVQKNLFRPAHILAWNALIDFVENTLASDNFIKLNSARRRWNISSLDDLRENYPEYQIIEACKDLNLASKGEKKILHGLLSKRNLCAHPSNYHPDFNQTLGYIADILSSIRTLQTKNY